MYLHFGYNSILTGWMWSIRIDSRVDLLDEDGIADWIAKWTNGMKQIFLLFSNIR